MTGLCALCLTALLAALVRLAESVGPVVRCEPCDVGALVQCKPLPRDCAERPLQALLDGRGVCLKKLSSALVPPQITGKRYTYNSHFQVRPVSVLPSTGSTPRGQAVLEPKAALLHSKLGMIQKEQSKKSQSYKVESVSGGVHTDVHNFSLESKMEAEYGPCRREIESVLKNLKISNVLNPRFFRIPNCDRKGFYKKKQCRPSKGRRRGYCWCVDKYGQPLPGYESKEQGQVHCYSMEKK
uniref:Thyroglobulin type-1 domain-containing protein n=1 Tax=Electrophorus electricus TaxID=8005 RepID=A0AAY5EZP4_ELEEL